MRTGVDGGLGLGLGLVGLEPWDRITIIIVFKAINLS